MADLDLAVVIVSWNTRDLTIDTLRTLYADLDAHGPHAEVWVFDGASSDGSAEAIREQFPRVHLIAHDRNLGFSGGNNFAMRAIGFGDSGAKPTSAALPRAVYLLNPDTLTHAGATRTLFDALCALPKAGVVGARLTFGDGSFQHSAFRFPGLAQLIIELFPVPGRLYESKLNGRYPHELYTGQTPFPVDHPLGATMMIKREAILDTGLFDEGYFMYVEEVDWSRRIRNAGWEIYCVPAAHVTHLGGQSTQQARPQNITNLWRSRLRFYDRSYSPIKRQLARTLIRLGMRRQIALTQRACTNRNITPKERDALIYAYRTVQRL